MISIIVCSISPPNFKMLYNSIKTTIGEIPYEVIRIDNNVLKLDIAKAYNKGLEQAKFEFVLFLHEDLIFHTLNWGALLLKYFLNNPAIGVIGVAGSTVQSKIPSGWWENYPDRLVMNILQHKPSGMVVHRESGFHGEDHQEVVVIDGVLIALRKDPNIRFNEKLTGFHNYDKSICLEYRNYNYKIIVINSILIEHFSNGNKNRDWVFSSIKFQKLYSGLLPQNISSIPIFKMELLNLYLKFIASCVKVGENRLAFRYWLLYFLRNPLKKSHFKTIIFLSKNILNSSFK